MKSYWRTIAAPIIHRTLEENKGKSEKEIRAALQAAYPFGERAHHPYKIWCNEVQLQRKLRKTKNAPVEQGRLF